MDDFDTFDFLDSNSNFELPDPSRFGSTFEDQTFCIKSLITQSTLDADLKAKDSELKLNKLDKGITQKTKDIDEATRKNQMLQRELDALNEKYDSIKEKDSQEMKELIELETLCKNRASFKLHPVDAQRFQILRFRLFACKLLTGIRWNYAESNDKKLVGYVFNAHTEHIKKFNIDLEKTDPAAVSKQLWNMILAGGLGKKHPAPASNDKENACSNIKSKKTLIKT